MLVPSKPQILLSSLSYEPATQPKSRWRESTFYPSGRDALAAALSHFSLSVGANVILPAFICRSVSDRLKFLGYKPYFIDSSIDSPFPTSEALGQACFGKEAEILLLVDLFGFFPEGRLDAVKSARESGCFVVEDRCHSALTVPSEEVADAVIYSIRKSIPCPDGGALWLAKKRKTCFESSGSLLSFLHSIPYVLKMELEKLVCWFGWPNIYAESLTSARETISAANLDSEGLSPRAWSSDLPSWVLSQQLKKAIFLDYIAQQRRLNYRCISEGLDGIKPLLKLQDGTVPQVFPILDRSGQLKNYLRDHGVGAYCWPGNELPAYVSNNRERFPNTIRWNHDIVCLPVHQSLNIRHIERMVKLVKNFFAAGR